MRNKSRSGWKGESRRHSLARKRIHTADGSILPSLISTMTTTTMNANTVVFLTKEGKVKLNFKSDRALRIAKEFYNKFGTPELITEDSLTWWIEYEDMNGYKWDKIELRDNDYNPIILRSTFTSNKKLTDHDITTLEQNILYSNVWNYRIKRKIFGNPIIKIKITGRSIEEISEQRMKLESKLKEYGFAYI